LPECLESLAADCVTAGFAASAAVPKTIGAEPDIQLTLTKHAVLFTLAAFFDLLALVAANFNFGSAHGKTLSLEGKTSKVPLVTTGCELRAMSYEQALDIRGDDPIDRWPFPDT
jgi:hypothetical protein